MEKGVKTFHKTIGISTHLFGNCSRGTQHVKFFLIHSQCCSESNKRGGDLFH